MPSHEDYLDNLLKNMEKTEGTQSAEQEAVAIPADITPEIEEELPADIMSEIEEELPADIMSEIEEELPADIMSEIEEELPADIMPEIEEELPADIISEIEEELPADIMPEIEEELPADIFSDIKEELPADITPEIEEELPADIMSEIEEELPADIIPEIEEELPADIMSEIEEELPADIMSEIEEELPADILAEIEEKLPADILSEIEEELPADILAEIEEKLPEDIMAEIEEELPADILAEIEEELPADILSEIEEAPESDEEIDLNDLDSLSDLGAVSGMSEDEIERILAASAEEGQEQADEDSIVAEEPSDEDLLAMIEDAEDSDLQDIQDMLDKADNNEAVGEEIEALLHGSENPEPPEASSIINTENEKVKSAQDKKRLRQEKAAAKKAAKVAAKEAKAAAKAAAKLAKEAKEAEASIAPASEKAEEVLPDDMLSMQDIDTLLLDSIVAEADQTGLNNEEKVDFDDFVAELSGANTSDAEPAMEEEAAAESNEDDLGFDLGSLFGDEDGGSLDIDVDSMSENDSSFPDFVDLEGGDVDAALPDFENEGKKKKGLLSRFFDMLTEEDEDEESESLRLSDENKNILNDLDKEKNAKKKKKKVKKPVPGQGDGDGEEGGKGGKAKKAKKVKKPKPEKPKKEPEPEPLIPEKKLSLKKVLPVLLVCASLGVLLVVFANATVDYTDKQNAKEAYYAGDYQTCYENLFGKDLNESEQIMFGTSESILYIRLWLREYEMFAEAGEEVEALDSLIQTVANYPHLYIYAVQWNAGEEVMAGYESILNILYEKYGLTEAQAQEIAAVRSNYEYTRRVVAIVQGKPYGYWEEPVVVETEPEEPMRDPLPDELPEEGDLEEGQYIGN